MILTTTIPTRDFSAFSRDRQFELDPPPTNTFIPSATVSLTQETGKLNIQWVEDSVKHLRRLGPEKIIEDILVRARKDAGRFPRSARVHSNFGLALLNSGDFEGAAREFESALELDASHYVAMVNLARVQVTQGKFSQAKTLYMRIHQIRPSDTAPLLGLAYILMREGDFLSASNQLKQVLRVDEDSTLAHYQMAVALLALVKPHDAINHLRMAASLAVRSPEVHQALAVAYTMSGDFRRAVRSFRAALTLEPMMREAVHGLSNAFIHQGQFEDAIRLLTSYLEHTRDDWDAKEILAFAYKQEKRYVSSRSQLMEAVQGLSVAGDLTKRRRTRMLNNIAVSFAYDGDLEEAERWINKAISLNPDYHPKLYENLARFCLQKNQPGRAEQAVKDCRVRFPERKEASYLMVACLQQQERYDEAISELEGMLRNKKSEARAYAYLGGLIADAKRDFDGALSVLKEGHKHYPGDALLINNLAYVLLIRGEVEMARGVLGSSTSSPPDQETNVYLTCTNGLLLLWEQKLDEGRARYLEAEKLARQNSSWDLARTVLQKMHLELARAHTRNGNLDAAINEVGLGLRVKSGKKHPYREDLELLSVMLAKGRRVN